MPEPAAFNAYEVARAQLDRTAELMGLDDTARRLLRSPMNEHTFQVPVRMDDGSVRIFDGFRVVHNDARGPAWGGVRFHPLETLDTIRAIAMWITWKAAVVDIPMGGSMGGVVCDPHDLSPLEQERLCRGWIRRSARHLGPQRDVPAPDVMTHGQHMTWMLDEWEAVSGAHDPGAITGKSVTAGGSKGRVQATGYGLVYVLREALKIAGVAPETTTASVQGYGTVGRHAVELYRQIGGTVRCVAAWDPEEGVAHAYTSDDGLEPELLDRVCDRFGSIRRRRAEEAGLTVLPGDEWLEQDVDVLLPAALENQISAATVDRIRPRVRFILEGANGPTSPEAEATLTERGVVVIPDLFANAGGLVCSYLEQVQSNTNYYWSMAEVLSKLDLMLTDAWMEVSDLASSRDLTLREAAMVIAVHRIAEMCRERGWL